MQYDATGFKKRYKEAPDDERTESLKPKTTGTQTIIRGSQHYSKQPIVPEQKADKESVSSSSESVNEEIKSVPFCSNSLVQSTTSSSESLDEEIKSAPSCSHSLVQSTTSSSESLDEEIKSVPSCSRSFVQSTTSSSESLDEEIKSAPSCSHSLVQSATYEKMKSVPSYSQSLAPSTTSSSSNVKPTRKSTSVASDNEHYSFASAASDRNVEIKRNEFRSSDGEEVDQIGTAGSVKSSSRKGSRKGKKIQNKSDRKRSKNSLKPKKTTQRKSASGADTIQKGQVSKKKNSAKLTKSLIMEPTFPAQSDQRATTSSSSLPTRHITLNNSSSYKVAGIFQKN